MATHPEKQGEGMKRVRRTAKKTIVSSASASNESTPSASASASAWSAAAASRGGALFNSARKSDVTAFLRQLIMLLEAGTPILKSLQTLSTRGRRGIQALVTDICHYVESGNPLWQAFERYPNQFDVVFTNNVKASEASGTLVSVLERLVSYRERRALLEKRVRGAMLYPVILLLMCFGVLMVITKFVIPSFQDMFDKLSIPLPTFTKNFLAVSTFLGKWWLAGVLVLIALYIIYKFVLMKNPLWRLKLDRIKLMIPIVGPIAQQTAIVELTRTLALLLRSGLSIMVTLDLVRNAIHNKAVAQTLEDVRESVERGAGIEEPLRRHEGVIPAIVTDMLVTGEESGSLDSIAEQVANTYEEEVNIKVSTLGDALIPIVVVFLGGVVLLLAFAMGKPLLELMNQLNAPGGG